jgi:hypothetical protein
MRALVFIAGLTCSLTLRGATLEQLSVEDMSVKSTLIVRGRISGCAGEQKGSVIFTRCKVSVTERWKGVGTAQLEFMVPGGTASGLSQVFTGTPKFAKGSEHVLFLWAGRSGNLQVIGLSQGVFDVGVLGGSATVKRPASSEVMLNAAGQAVKDESVQMSLGDLRARVNRAIASTSIIGSTAR